MKQFRTITIAFLISIIFAFSAAAENYFLCLASYKNQQSAKDLVYQLRQDFIPAGIYKATSSGTDLYRVFIEIPYDNPQQAKEAAKVLESLDCFSKYNFKGMWSFTADIKVDKGNMLPLKITEPTPSEKDTKEIEVAEVPVINTAPVEKVEKTERAEPKLIEPTITINEKLPDEEIKIELLTPEEFYNEKNDDSAIDDSAIKEPSIERPSDEIPNEELTAKEMPFETDQEIPLSNEKPYSILIRSYKNEANAQKDAKRLYELGFSPYIVKTYDEESFFSFNIHTDASDKMEDEFPVQEKLSQAGIDFTIISDFRTFKDKIASFDKLAKENKVNYEVSDKNLADLYSENVLNCIINFPTVNNFAIDQVGVFDFSNIEDGKERIASLQSLFSTVKNIDFSDSSIDCCSFCVFNDELYSKSISAAMFTGSGFNYKAETLENIIPFIIKSGEMDCILDTDENSTYLFCISKDKKSFIFLETTDYSKEELFSIFNNNIENKGLLTYDEVKNTLLILPDKSAQFDAKFRSFMLEKVTYEYSKGREYSSWSTPLVGQWFAEGSYILKDEILSLGFFYLNYEYLANLTHELFMEAKIQDTDKEKESHYSKINDGNSWYLDNEFMKELSFTQKAYIFAIDVFSDSIFTEDNLIEISRQLKIW